MNIYIYIYIYMVPPPTQGPTCLKNLLACAVFSTLSCALGKAMNIIYIYIYISILFPESSSVAKWKYSGLLRVTPASVALLVQHEEW